MCLQCTRGSVWCKLADWKAQRQPITSRAVLFRMEAVGEILARGQAPRVHLHGVQWFSWVGRPQRGLWKQPLNVRWVVSVAVKHLWVVSDGGDVCLRLLQHRSVGLLILGKKSMKTQFLDFGRWYYVKGINLAKMRTHRHVRLKCLSQMSLKAWKLLNKSFLNKRNDD